MNKYFLVFQNIYYAVTIERGYIFIHSNQLPEPVKSADKVFPVVSTGSLQMISRIVLH